MFSGNTTAQQKRFDDLLAKEGPALMRLSAAYTNGGSDREDLFQDIAFAIWQALPRFRGECSERTFAFRIAHNRGMAYLARRRPTGVPAEEIQLHDPKPDPETGYSQEQQGTRLFEAIYQLPLGYKQVITLTLEGMAYTEIAEILGLSESNVGVRLNRAKQMLRQLLQVQK